MSPLSLTVRHLERETALSFTSRLAERNGLSFVQDLCSDMGINWLDMTRGSPEALSTLANVASANFDDLLRCAVRKFDGRRYAINGQVLSHGTLFRRTLRYCPHCLLEDDRINGPLGRFGRLEWQLLSFRICPTHLSPLVALPKPENSVSPHDFWQRTNSCWDYEVQGSADAAQPVRIGAEFENYLIHRLVGEVDQSWLGQLELDLVCRLCEGLGIVLEYGPKAFRSNLSSAELAHATAVGFQAAKKGKSGLRSAFRTVKMASRGSVKGYLSDFGTIAQWLTRVDVFDPRYAQIIEVFTSFVFENYALADGQIVLGRSSSVRRVHSILGTANAVGLSNARVAKFVAAEAIGSRGRNGKVFLEGDQCLQRIQEFADCVTCSEAKQELGLSFEMLDRLRRSGLIASRFNLAELCPVYHPDDINKFKKSVFKHAAEVDEIPKGYKPLNKISVTVQTKVEHVIQLAQCGQLYTLCFRSGLNGLWSLHADPRELRNQLSVDPPDGFTKEQLKSIFGLTFPTSNKLIQNGILKTQSMRHGRGRNKLALITKPAMKDFLKYYITLGMIVRDNNCQAYRVKLELERLGVLPIDLGENCCKVYLRCEIEPTGYPIRPWLDHYLDAISELSTTPVPRSGRARLTAPVIRLDSAEAAR